jgi:hypothetical protein
MIGQAGGYLALATQLHCVGLHGTVPANSSSSIMWCESIFFFFTSPFSFLPFEFFFLLLLLLLLFFLFMEGLGFFWSAYYTIQIEKQKDGVG